MGGKADLVTNPVRQGGVSGCLKCSPGVCRLGHSHGAGRGHFCDTTQSTTEGQAAMSATLKRAARCESAVQPVRPI